LNAVEVWNEPFGYWAWKPNPDPAAYARLARVAAEAVKAVDPSVKVLISGDVLQVRTDGKIVDWLRNVLAAEPGLKSLVDAYSVHPYPHPRVLGPYDDRPDPRWDFRRVELTHQIDPSRPIWITEVGWSTAPGVDDAISEAQQATFIRGAVERSLGKWGGFVERIFVYSWDRSNGTAGDREGNYGLRRADGSTKPAWAALAALLQTSPPLPAPQAPSANSVPTRPSLTLRVSPARLSVGRRGQGDFALRLDRSANAGSPALRISGLPRGVRAVGIGSLSGTTPAGVRIQVGRSVRPGTYRLRFRGTLAGAVATTAATLVVTRKATPLSPLRLLSAWRSLRPR
jgi:hypothetical protein